MLVLTVEVSSQYDVVRGHGDSDQGIGEHVTEVIYLCAFGRGWAIGTTDNNRLWGAGTRFKLHPHCFTGRATEVVAKLDTTETMITNENSDSTISPGGGTRLVFVRRSITPKGGVSRDTKSDTWS